MVSTQYPVVPPFHDREPVDSQACGAKKGTLDASNVVGKTQKTIEDIFETNFSTQNHFYNLDAKAILHLEALSDTYQKALVEYNTAMVVGKAVSANPPSPRRVEEDSDFLLAVEDQIKEIKAAQVRSAPPGSVAERWEQLQISATERHAEIRAAEGDKLIINVCNGVLAYYAKLFVKLIESQYTRVPSGDDGNCLLYSVLSDLKHVKPATYQSLVLEAGREDQKLLSNLLRKKIGNYFRDHLDKWRETLGSDLIVKEAIEQAEKDKEWLGEPHILALAEMFDCSIEIFSSASVHLNSAQIKDDALVPGEDYIQNRLATDKLYLLRTNNNHFDALLKKEIVLEEPASKRSRAQ